VSHPPLYHRRIAVIAPNWLGDAVMSRAAIGVLGASGARVSVIAAPYAARVFQGMTGVDEVIVDSRGGRMKRIRDRASALRATEPDGVLLLPPSFSSAVSPWLARVSVRAGDGTDGRRQLLTHVLQPAATRSEHLCDTYARLARLVLKGIGLEAGADPSPARLAVSDSDRVEAQRALAGTGIGGVDYAVVVPGAAFGPAKTWPAEKFRELCEGLTETGPVVLAGSGAERALCAQVSDGLTGVWNVAGDTSLGGFLGLLEGAHVVVANDSGTPHVSAALGTPTVVLFGSTSPQWTAPRGDRVSVVHHPVHCNPCFRRTCPTQLECFNGIDVARVLEEAQRLPVSTGPGETSPAPA